MSFLKNKKEEIMNILSTFIVYLCYGTCYLLRPISVTAYNYFP